MSDPDATVAMKDLLDRQAAALEKVLETLDHEREALMNRDAAALELITKEKQEALAKADELEQQRLALAPDLNAMELLAATPDVAPRWEKLLDLTRRCREQNDTNGRMIRRQARRVESTLQLMRGQPGNAGVYGPDGESSRSGGSNRPPIASV
ncbi:MAG: flagellar protein FlgN [Gammaproteobacteria bacterium]|nr:flagellar protein FlgN [Gammaproteobacteria bacterium]